MLNCIVQMNSLSVTFNFYQSSFLWSPILLSQICSFRYLFPSIFCTCLDHFSNTYIYNFQLCWINSFRHWYSSFSDSADWLYLHFFRSLTKSFTYYICLFCTFVCWWGSYDSKQAVIGKTCVKYPYIISCLLCPLFFQCDQKEYQIFHSFYQFFSVNRGVLQLRWKPMLLWNLPQNTRWWTLLYKR